MYSHKPFTEVFPTSHVVLYCVNRSLYKRSLSSSLRHIGHNLTLQWIFQTWGSVATDSPLLLFTQYETCLIVISSHCLAKRRTRSKEVEQVKELAQKKKTNCLLPKMS